MAKYRLLTLTELQELEKEFVEYLIINGIDKDTWEKTKSTKPAEAEQIVDLFSDVVFEKILRQTTHLKHVSPSSIKLFKCEAEEITLIGVDCDQAEVDLSTETGWQTALQHPELLNVYTQSKAYKKAGRESELFDMMQYGCVKSDDVLYEVFEKLLQL